MFELNLPPVSAFNAGSSKKSGVKGLAGKSIKIPMLSQNKHPTIVLDSPYINGGKQHPDVLEAAKNLNAEQLESARNIINSNGWHTN